MKIMNFLLIHKHILCYIIIIVINIKLGFLVLFNRIHEGFKIFFIVL